MPRKAKAVSEVIARWTCPACGRAFGRANQSHQCEPAMSLDDYLAGKPAAYRAICHTVIAHLEMLGPIVVDAVHVGVLIKRARTFAELRPRRDGLALSVLLSRVLEHPRITRTIKTRGRRAAHFIVLRDAADVDDDVRAWLSEAYHSSPL